MNYHPVAIPGGMTKGSDTLTVADTSELKPGQIIRITELKDLSLPVHSTSGGVQRLRKQMTRVVSKTATNMTISPPLYWTLQSHLAPRLVAAADQVNGVGLEDLRIEGIEGKRRLVDFDQCYGCLVPGILSDPVFV